MKHRNVDIELRFDHYYRSICTVKIHDLLCQHRIHWRKYFCFVKYFVFVASILLIVICVNCVKCNSNMQNISENDRFADGRIWREWLLKLDFIMHTKSFEKSSNDIVCMLRKKRLLKHPQTIYFQIITLQNSQYFIKLIKCLKSLCFVSSTFDNTILNVSHSFNKCRER